MNWQAGTMLHPGAQRSEHRIKAPACRETQQAGTVTTSWQSGRQHGARPQHHLGISLRLAPTQHNRCISSRQNNLKSLSEKRGEDQYYRGRNNRVVQYASLHTTLTIALTIRNTLGDYEYHK